jgi:hypothetical protein
MELNEKNGHASIEEILASVRRIIAEEPVRSGPRIDVQVSARQAYPKGDGLLDDPSDFDLPSMFRTPSASSVEKPAPLFGRLSEAIRAASTTSVYGGDRADQALSTLKLHRSEAGETNGAPPHFLLAAFHENTGARTDEIAASGPQATLSSSITEPTSPSPVAAAPSDTPLAPVATNEQPAPAAPAPQVPRQMAAFKDTRFRGMGSSPAPLEPVQPFVSPFEAAATEALVAAADKTAEAASAPLPAVAADEPQATDPAIGHDGLAAEVSGGLAAAIAASYPALAAETVPQEPTAARIPPPVPPLPAPQLHDTAANAAPPSQIEDSTADLLRPMLRQWLAENMPRMVEKALHIEVAESVKSTKK